MYKGKLIPEAAEDRIKTEEFINSAGIKILLQSIPPLLVPRLQNSIKFPKKPTYIVELASGDKQIFDHDEKSIATVEEKAAWAKYLEDQQMAESELSQKMMIAILQEGVIVDENDPGIKRWRKRQEIMGIPVSDDIDEWLQHYKETEIVKNTNDMRLIMERVMAITGVSKEDIDAAKASFQSDMEPES